MRKTAPAKPLIPRQIWEAALGSLELQVSRPSYATWLKDTTGLSFDDNRMVVGVPSPFVAQWLERRMSSLIETTLSQVAGRPTTVRFQVMTEPASNASLLEGTQASSSPIPRATNGHTAANGTRSSTLNPKYTLDSFVVGESNQLAYAAAQAVSSRPGTAYNPLFLYGGVGLGKTHLLHGIGHASASRGLSYLYVSSEQFTNEFITSIQTKRTREFREKYRSVDVLLMDDIQFMRGKDAIQEGFFHTFNDLHNANRQIVIACDRPSSALAPLEDRLRSRFQWGLSADIQMPDQETRIAILEVKANHMGMDVPREVLMMISQNFLSSIRDMEGALNRVCAYADLTAQPLCLDLAYRSLGDLLITKQRKIPPADVVIAQVCAYYDIDIQAVTSKRRDRKVTQARQVAIYLLRERAQITLKDIGLLMGNRDHTTIRYACIKVMQAKETDPNLKKQLTSIQADIESVLTN
jgi:chromosomal replication initiator protein